MVRSIHDTYQSSVDKLSLDRDLSSFLAKSKNPVTKDIAWRIARCADDHNIWFVQDPDRGWIHGRFWKCSSKLCSFCISCESRRRRRSLFEAIEHLAAGPRKWHFATFTIENPSASIITTRNIVNEAWSKFRKRAVFAEVRAAAKSEEFTITPKGFHYHIHTLIDTKRIDYQAWRRHWTECVEASDGASRNLYGFQTIDGYLIINVKPVRNPRDIVQELGKYITKSTSFRDLSRETLNELASVKRWNRMFELLGDLRNQKRGERGAKPERAIVHTKRISDGLHTDLFWFEKKRENSRNFMHDTLATKFKSHVYSIHEVRKITANVASRERLSRPFRDSSDRT